MQNTEIFKQLVTFNTQAEEIHADNVRAGWWTDLQTGASILATRNRGEILMLVVSELSEASEGDRLSLMDDKLHHRTMVEVELADAKIRILDVGGADRLDLSGAALELLNEAMVPQISLNAYKGIDAALMQIVNQISRAMEGNRKKNAFDHLLTHRRAYEVGLACALVLIHELGALLNLDVDAAVAEKRAYNAQRADHKPENRLRAGGKSY